MENIPKRPGLITVLQIVLVLSGISNGLHLVFFAISIITGNGNDPVFFSPTQLIKACVLATLFITAAYGIWKIRNYGRWLGAASFFLIAIASSYSMFSVAVDIPNPAFQFFSKNVMLLINGSQVILFTAATFYLMFSPRVIEYFNPKLNGKITQPPPSFDA